ncbi:TIGR00341 family protein [Chitinophaga sp. S165]|uniref:TIGR00341 family protein n=1 Tax=Chitinophaga sp. S165 TaxID=2135462 RepID=UPI000D7149D6|nr:TIGR00341 family protein [Chitinophaga sp. S165]PWV51692.1 putative hydrophobic protein (TIGR00341 family) [Chitinophaga sp. S165]
MKKIYQAIRDFIADRFNLSEDKADERQIIESIKRDVHFKGTNLWTLIFAIFIASIGLNVNSTAVIIGAMLISPLMGPIMGIGLGIGINDFDLLKKGVKNLLIAAVFSVATSSFYFAVTPLHEASSEILARTNPSVWDVFIALSGGFAGIIAGTRKEKGNVIPGVAIATALMPPLCTAGFGIATGQIYFFLGAIYLFLINCLFICLATFLIVKHLKFNKVEFASIETEKKVSRYILTIVVLTVLPSIYLAYRIVQRSIFESNAGKFVQSEFHFPRTQVVTHNYKFDGKQGNIELLLVGQPLSEALLDSLKNKMAAYKLYRTKLVVRQGLDAKQQIDLTAIKASVLEEIFDNRNNLDSLLTPGNTAEGTIPDLREELKALYPDLMEYSLAPVILIQTDSVRTDTVTLFTARFTKRLSGKEKGKLGSWLKERTQSDSIKVLIEY